MNFFAGSFVGYKAQTPATHAEACGLAELEAERLAAIQFTLQQVKALRQARAQKDAAAEAVYADTLLRHSKPLFLSAVRANTRLKPHRRLPLAECLSMAEVLDFSQPLPEAVPVRPHPKKSGGHRMIHNHGIMHRTAQDAINRVLGEYLKPRSFQFSRKGTHAAINHARSLIGAGYVHLARLDIKDFYANFSADALIEGLPIPKDVAEHAVIGRHMKVCIDKGSKTRGQLNGHYASQAQSFLPLARQGIPTGSSTSTIVSMIAISRLAWSLIDGVAIINYADDFLVLAMTHAQLIDGVEALIASVAKLPDGHFSLLLKEQSPVTNGLRFLGHRLYLKDGMLRVAPSDASLEKMHADLNRIELQLQPLLSKPWKKNHALALRLAATYYARVQGYRAAFSACTELDTRWLAGMIYGLDDTLKSLGVSPDQAKATVEPWMVDKTYAYMFKD
jgi:Reverse transcriptase (RNA-dependent DNA polymerase)